MRLLLLLLAGLCTGTLMYAQDPVFSQYYAAPIQLNPAFAGSAIAPRLGTIYRHQWPNLNNAYRTYSVYYEQPIDRLNSGVGFQVSGDNAGDGLLKKTNVSAIYAYNLPIGRNFLIKIGVEAGMLQSTVDWNRLVFPDQLDATGGNINPSGELTPENPTRTNFDASAGLLLLSEHLWFGASLKHLNTPNESFLQVNNNLNDGLPLRYTFQAGSEIIVKKGNKRKPDTFLSPNLLFTSQGPYQQINAGAYAGVGALFGGLWYRHTFGNADAAIVMAGVREGIFKFGFSYDLTVSNLSGYSGGAYEVTLGLLFDQHERARNRKKRTDWSDCLHMFQ